MQLPSHLLSLLANSTRRREEGRRRVKYFQPIYSPDIQFTVLSVADVPRDSAELRLWHGPLACARGIHMNEMFFFLRIFKILIGYQEAYSNRISQRNFRKFSRNHNKSRSYKHIFRSVWLEKLWPVNHFTADAACRKERWYIFQLLISLQFLFQSIVRKDHAKI